MCFKREKEPSEDGFESTCNKLLVVVVVVVAAEGYVAHMLCCLKTELFGFDFFFFSFWSLTRMDGCLFNFQCGQVAP
jgi:hypothetical protein